MQAALTARAPAVARPSSRAAARPAPAARSVRVMSAPKPEAIEQAVKDAEESCAGGATGECAAAWDTVEELSAAAAHAKANSKSSTDPLEDKRVNEYCEDNPAEPECRVYDD
ncbi:hypothetical protein D9Q98_003422 [Chlorella vulgaris]|uniref:CP12 domain-containing protein n=1 Tax=Chlorella vulgaris TaxID=3077 RepID=A0A9D4TT36_CHLVU|nr:hypothetical protein D9Q98_003422 [Chlorella vulgaris]